MTKTLLAGAALAVLLPAHASISVNAPSFTYDENFDMLTTSTSALPWTNDATLPGWSLFISTGLPAPTYAADSGGSNAGTFRSFGVNGEADRALGSTASGGSYFGSPASGAIAGWIVLALSNDSGAAIDGFTLAYQGEQWRNGGNTSAQSLTLEYGLGASYETVAAWTAPGGSFDFTSPVVGSTAAAVDGNGAGLVSGLGGSVAGLAWAPGEQLFIRWADRNDVGSDHGLGIDNLQFSVSAVPEPGRWTLMLAGLAAGGLLLRRRA